MIILNYFLKNITGNVKGIKIRSYSTGWLFTTENPDNIATRDLTIEAII